MTATDFRVQLFEKGMDQSRRQCEYFLICSNCIYLSGKYRILQDQINDFDERNLTFKIQDHLSNTPKSKRNAQYETQVSLEAFPLSETVVRDCHVVSVHHRRLRTAQTDHFTAFYYFEP